MSTERPLTVETLRRYMEDLLPPVVYCSLEDYERFAPLMEAEFPDVAFGYSPMVQPGQVIAVHPEKAMRRPDLSGWRWES